MNLNCHAVIESADEACLTPASKFEFNALCVSKDIDPGVAMENVFLAKNSRYMTCVEVSKYLDNNF